MRGWENRPHTLRLDLLSSFSLGVKLSTSIYRLALGPDHVGRGMEGIRYRGCNDSDAYLRRRAIASDLRNLVFERANISC